MLIKRINLYGTSAACKKGLLILENLPQIKRIDSIRDPAAFLLVLRQPLSEKELIPLLSGSGISGFSYN